MPYIYWWLDASIPCVKIGYGDLPEGRMERYAREYRMRVEPGSLQQHALPEHICRTAERRLHEAMKLRGHGTIRLAGKTAMSAGAQEVFALNGRSYLEISAFLTQELLRHVDGTQRALDNSVPRSQFHTSALPAAFFEKDCPFRDEILQVAHEKGNVAQLIELGMWYRMGWGENLPKDPTTALACYRAAADLGDVEAAFSVGEILASGEAEGPSPVAASAYYERAALAGHPGAQAALGELYYLGREVPLDYKSAAQWLAKALKAAHPPRNAGFRLATLYRAGKGVGRDIKYSIALLREEANRSSVESMLELANIYEQGDGVPRDLIESYNWYQEAVTWSSAKAMYELGRIHRDAIGVDFDPAQAHMWFSVCASNCEPNEVELLLNATRERDALASQMSVDELEQADRLFRLFYDPDE